MTDIVSRAKRLLENTTPGPWYPHEDEWDGDMVVNDAGREMSWHGEQLRVIIQAGNPIPDSDLIAAAPELAKAVIAQAEEIERLKAESTWQYGVTYTGVNHGGDHMEWIEITDDPEWDKETLALKARQWRKRGQSPRIVRRRVSPVEVME